MRFRQAKRWQAGERDFNASRVGHVTYDPKAPAGKTIADLFEAVAEEHLIQPTIIYDFPMAISPLAKNSRKPEDAKDWVERFEVFVGGMEIGNAFSELNDPDEQRRRFEQQPAEKERGDEEAHQMDEDYVQGALVWLAAYGRGRHRHRSRDHVDDGIEIHP